MSWWGRHRRDALAASSSALAEGVRDGSLSADVATRLLADLVARARPGSPDVCTAAGAVLAVVTAAGPPADALPLAAQYLALCTDAHGIGDRTTSAARRRYALLLSAVGRHDSAATVCQATLDSLQALTPADDPSGLIRLELRRFVCTVLMTAERVDELRSACTDLAAAIEAVDDEHDALRRVATITLGHALMGAKLPDSALQVLESVSGAPESADGLAELAMVSATLQSARVGWRWNAPVVRVTVTRADRAVEWHREHLGDEHPTTLYARIERASVALRAGRPADAQAQVEDVLCVAAPAGSATERVQLRGRLVLCRALVERGRPGPALRAAAALRDHPRLRAEPLLQASLLPWADAHAAQAHSELGDDSAALDLLGPFWERDLDADPVFLAVALLACSTAALALCRGGQHADALALVRRVQARAAAVPGVEQSTELWLTGTAGQVLAGMGQATEAAAVLTPVVTALLAPPIPLTVRESRVIETLARCLRDLGRAEEAVPLLAAVVERLRVLVGADHPDYQRAVALQAAPVGDSEPADGEPGGGGTGTPTPAA